MQGLNSHLLGQIALERKLLTPEQLREALDLQAGQPEPRPLGSILVESGFLTEAQLSQVVDEQRRRLRQDTPYAPYRKEDLFFGRLLVKGGHAAEARVNEALRAQQDLAERGVRKRVGEILVEAGHIAPEAVFAVLKVQGKVLMSCTFCGAHFNVLRSIADKAACRKCGMPLQDKAAEVRADATAYLLPPVDVSTLRRAIPTPVPTAAPAPAAAGDAPPGRAGMSISLLVTIILTLLLLALLLFSK